jgi:hypothetical protein
MWHGEGIDLGPRGESGEGGEGEGEGGREQADQ